MGEGSRRQQKAPLPLLWERGWSGGDFTIELRADQFTDLVFDLVGLREAVEGVLGKDLLPVEKDFERSCSTGGNRHSPELILVVMQQVLRQTGGSSEIPSGGAVFDPYNWLLFRRGLAGGAFTRHVVSSVRLRSSRRLDPWPQGPLRVVSVAWMGCQYDLSSPVGCTPCALRQG